MLTGRPSCCLIKSALAARERPAVGELILGTRSRRLSRSRPDGVQMHASPPTRGANHRAHRAPESSCRVTSPNKSHPPKSQPKTRQGKARQCTPARCMYVAWDVRERPCLPKTGHTRRTCRIPLRGLSIAHPSLEPRRMHCNKSVSSLHQTADSVRPLPRPPLSMLSPMSQPPLEAVHQASA